ncbi:MAG: Flp family type IVb pilin [Novosphingobium sp.]|nr:Flp family type IVb pilin [Novosphingobium sp.]
MRFIHRLSRDQTGATAIEYALLCGLIAIAAVTAMQGIGNQLNTTFNSTSSYMAN